MRIVVSRDANTTEVIGPVCELYPITFSKQIFDSPDTPAENTPLHLFQTSGGDDDFNWVLWNPDESSDSDRYLRESIENPRLAINDFTDTLDGDGDKVLSTNETDRLTTATNLADTEANDELFAELVNQTIRVPVYGGSGNVEHIAVMRVNSVVESGNREFLATFVRYDDQACEE
jgi:hypothetical protein